MINIETKENRNIINLFCWGGVLFSIMFLSLIYIDRNWFFFIASCLFSIQLFSAIRFYISGGVARTWNQSGIITMMTLGFLFAYFSTKDLFRSASFYGYIFLWFIFILSFVIIWRFAANYMEKSRERIIEQGRFDFERCIFRPTVMLPPEGKFEQLFVAVGPMLMGLAIYLGFHFRRPHADIEGLISSILGYFVGIGFLFAASCAYCELRFIRDWEKQTGRTMYVAGFGPTAERSEKSKEN